MRSFTFALALTLSGAGGGSAYANSITIGIASGAANQFPFIGIVPGAPGTRYQQAYGAGSFAGPISITGIDFFEEGTGSSFRSGTYSLYLSTITVGIDTLSTAFDSNLGADNALFTTVNLSAATPTVLSFNGGPFLYNPSNGNLLLDIRVSNPGSSGVGGVQYQFSGASGLFSRYYDFASPSVRGVGTGLVTKFDSTSRQAFRKLGL
jgi:hypothetical protein